jgi:hypothetical protein
MNAGAIGFHRWLAGRAPFLYGPKVFQFMPYDFVFALLPPHRTYGPMTHGMVEPIYCGAWHPATNICTFCPGRDYVTFNFTVETRHTANVDKVTTLLEQVEAMDIPARNKVIVEADD